MQPSSEFNIIVFIFYGIILWIVFVFFLTSLYFVAVFHNLLFFFLVAELTNDDDLFKTEVGFCVELRINR